MSGLILGHLCLGLVQLLLQRLGLQLQLLMHVLPELGCQPLLLNLCSSPSAPLAQRDQVGGDSFLGYTTERVSQSVRVWDGATGLAVKMRYLLEIAVEASKAFAISGSM